MEQMTLFIAVLVLVTTCDAFLFNIDVKGHKKNVSDRNFFLEAQVKDSKFLCLIIVANVCKNGNRSDNCFNFFMSFFHISKNFCKGYRCEKFFSTKSKMDRFAKMAHCCFR